MTVQWRRFFDGPTFVAQIWEYGNFSPALFIFLFFPSKKVEVGHQSSIIRNI